MKPNQTNLNDELNHHGILGMKWGVRRFQPYPSGYSGDGKYVGPKSGKTLSGRDESRLNKVNRKIDSRVRDAVDSGNKKSLKSLRKVISDEDYKRAYTDMAAKAIKSSVERGDVKKLKQFKNDLPKNDYKELLNRALFNNAVNNLKGKKMVKYGAKLSDDEIRNANNRVQNLTNINRSIKSIKTDNSKFMNTADIAKKLGVIIGVSVAAKGAYEKFTGVSGAAKGVSEKPTPKKG